MSAPYESPTSYWWDDHDNIVMLAWWMLARDHGARDFVYLIEKPWKFTAEYEEARRDYEAEVAGVVPLALDDDDRAIIAARAGGWRPVWADDGAGHE